MDSPILALIVEELFYPCTVDVDVIALVCGFDVLTVPLRGSALIAQAILILSDFKQDPLYILFKFKNLYLKEPVRLDDLHVVPDDLEALDLRTLRNVRLLVIVGMCCPFVSVGLIQSIFGVGIFILRSGESMLVLPNDRLSGLIVFLLERRGDMRGSIGRILANAGLFLLLWVLITRVAWFFVIPYWLFGLERVFSPIALASGNFIARFPYIIYTKALLFFKWGSPWRPVRPNAGRVGVFGEGAGTDFHFISIVYQQKLLYYWEINIDEGRGGDERIEGRKHE